MTLRAAIVLPLLAALAFATACSGGNGDSTPTSAVPGGPGATGGSNNGTPGTTQSVTLDFSFEPILSGFKRPVFVTSNGIAGDERLFVVEKGGLIRIVADGAIQPMPFLNVTSLVATSGNEQGLLGMAFHPDFERNGRFFIAYTGITAGAGDNTVAEYRVSAANPDLADPATGKIILAIPDFAANHNGGMIAFGPDGYLYFGTGDGGQAGDPRQNGQDKEALLGKMLRLDVDNVPPGSTYGIPASNPFANGGGAPEAWAYGLRNPWRFSFDRETGDLYIADVGQAKFEEVNFQSATSKGGENYGWNIVEGSECYTGSGCDKTTSVAPVVAYDHSKGCSITGGYVYRGAAYPEIAGLYLYTDYCSGTVWSLTRGDNTFSSSILLEGVDSVTSFGEDNAGEMYAVDDNGNLRKLVVERTVTTSAPASGQKRVKLTVESPEFGGGRALPSTYTCDGAGGSPQLSWDQTPPGTRSWVVMLEDTSAASEKQGHWVLFNIPPVATFLAANIPEGEQLGAGPIQQGKNVDGKVTYLAPCPGDGKEHTYRFVTYALNTTLALKGGATRDEILKAMDGHIIGEGELVAKYKR